MAKSQCQYCGSSMSDFLIPMHEENCPKRSSSSDIPVEVSTDYPVPPPLPPTPEPIEEPNAVEVLIAAPALTGQALPVSNGIFRPMSNPYFVMPTDLGNKLDRVMAASRSLAWPRSVRNVLLTGPRGAGKTSTGFQYAAKQGADSTLAGHGECYVVPCATYQESSQWWGQQGVSPERGTFYIPSGFVKAIETPGCTVILDDMNRTENPKVLNPLFLILDQDIREANIDDLGRKVTVAEGVTFIATVNEGYEYQGTDPIDLALRDRFDQIPVDYPPGDQIMEILQRRTGVAFDTAERIGRFARLLAEAPNADDRIFLSMRQLISIGEDITLGGSIRDGVMFSISAGMTDEQMEKINAILQQTLNDGYTGRMADWRPWGA